MLATQIPDGQILDDQDILKTLSLDAVTQQRLTEAFDVFSSAARSLERSYFSLGEEVCRLRKELEAERELRKRREALAEISALLAHEVRNPLGSVELFAELLAESGLPQQEREWVEQIRGGVRLLSATVNNVLEFHSQTPLKLAPTETSAVVCALGKLLAPMAQAEGMQLHIESCTQELRIQADRHRLEQVFLNLALNAFRFATTGGVLRIRVLRQDGCALVEFEDRGPGLAAEDKAKVFDAGFSTRTGGAGLGLTVAKRIVEQHAGNLDIINGMNGCTFQVRIPLATASA